MFSLFRRRGRSSKERKQQTTKNVANLEVANAKASGSGEDLKTSTPAQQADVQPQSQGASASNSKVNLDSTHPPPEIPKRRVAGYHRRGDGVVVSEISTDSRNEGADQQRQRSDNDTDDDRNSQDQSTSKQSIQSEKEPPSAKPAKSKSQAANRRSIFFRHFQAATSTPSEQRYRQLDEDQVHLVNDSTRSQPIEPEPQAAALTPTPPPPPPSPASPPAAVPAEASAKPKRFNPLEKGLDFFNEILMAKGRHRNNRSHHHHKGGGGVRQGPKSTNPQQDTAKKSPAEPAHLPKPECIPEPSGRLQNDQVTEESINTDTDDRRTPDVSVAAALTNAISVFSSVTAFKCADSSLINSSVTAQSPQDEQPKSTSTKLIADATRGESSTDDQTVDECASQQVLSENASREQNIPEEGAEDRLSTTTTTTPNVGEDPARSLSELTECDRDQITVNNMGQSQAKPEPPTPRSESRSPSPKVREFRESRVEEQKPPPASLPQLIVPEIVVEDFGNVHSQTGDIFYDVETNQSPLDDDQNRIEDHLLKVPEEEEGGPDDDDADEDEGDEEDQWHFINSAKEAEDQHGDDYDQDATSGTNYPKAENSSDSNLSTSDSGIATSEPIAKVLHLESCDLVNDSGKDPSAQGFRDGSATDCDESLPPCDNFEYYRYHPPLAESVVEVSIDEHDSQSGILIESISLPDVVVESTSACAGGVLKNTSSDSVNSEHTGYNGNGESDDVDNSDSVKMGNVHFIPIRVEKRRSVDDSVLMTKSANGGNTLYNGQQYNEEKSTLEITPEEDEQAEEEEEAAVADAEADEKMRDLVDQESRVSKQLDEAQKNIYNLESKITELQTKIDDLEKELSVKSWNVDRLQGELGAAHKEDECVRRRLRLLEEEKVTLRQKYNETEEELKSKYDDLEIRYKELEEKYKETQSLYANLQTELAKAQSDVDKCRQQTEKVRAEKDEQIRILGEALATAKEEQQAMQVKWQKEFETLRTQNADREETLMSDCEWQLRQMQKTCKDKLDKADHQRKEAIEQGEKIQQEADDKLHEVLHLKSCEAEVKQLRGLTADQENSIRSLQEQIEALRADLATANENLEEQIECVRRIKYQCDNAIYDKEREVLQRIDEVRNEAASLWERKLITEMTRLKMELESVYADDRREELDKLQAEHIEELKALTTRYTANEEELRAEIAELRESLQQRNEEFMELREKSDNAILQTRMHLDRADRDYQTAMCREEEKREKLAESLREEFEAEKLEMEEKFRERLSQVQDEFSKELQISAQEMSERHQKEMEQQWQKLIAEKEEAIQELEARHRKKLENAENRLHDTETRHQHDLKDLKSMYDTEKAALDKRDMSNVNEIEQLHRKCRCLTNLFEEMRMRYERRDPRPEDIREIAELRSRCEAQERDLYELTDRLREMQIQMEELQNGGNKKKSQIRKPPPKVIPTNCDVIYEENEERDSPPPPPPPRASPNRSTLEEEDTDEDEEEDDENEENSDSKQYQKNTINDDDKKKIIDGDKKKSLNDLQTMKDFNQIIEAEEC